MLIVDSNAYVPDKGSPYLAKSSEKKESAKKVDQAVSRSLCGDLAWGIAKSKFFRAAVVSGLSLAPLFAICILAFGMSYPPPWMIVAVTVGTFIVAFLAQLPLLKGFQKVHFEISNITRIFKKNYNEIFEIEGKGKLFLGALPNRISSEGEELVNNEGVRAVLSVNEPWERRFLGLSLPYTLNDWQALGVNYHVINVKDHSLLTPQELDAAADFIHYELEQGHNIYVHCLAGVGRSAMAVAAYLIKYQRFSVEEARQHILERRPVSTINKKVTRLTAYQLYLAVNGAPKTNL